MSAEGNLPTNIKNINWTAFIDGIEGWVHNPPVNVNWSEFMIDGVALTAVSLFGVMGTLMSIRVLISPQLRNNAFSALLVYLAVCDSNFLFFAVLTIGLPELWPW